MKPDDSQQQPQNCPACEYREWLRNLQQTALWIRLTTPPVVLRQLTETKS